MKQLSARDWIPLSAGDLNTASAPYKNPDNNDNSYIAAITAIIAITIAIRAIIIAIIVSAINIISDNIYYSSYHS